VTSSDLEQLFAQDGQVQSVTIIVDGSGRSSGSCFVEMTTKQEAATAIIRRNGLNG
jgi:RNA recognition motif-containing protein